MEKIWKHSKVILYLSLLIRVVNLKYLKLAHQSGGSVHTIEEDLDSLYKLKENECFTFMGKRYMIKNGALMPLILD